MIHWSIIKGIGATNTVTCRTTGGAIVPLSGAENFSCPYWSGEDQASGGSLAWVYNSPTGGTVDITVSPTIAATLAPGLYQWVLQLPDASAAYARGSFEIVAGPGSATATTTTYCTYNDVLDLAPWCKMVVNTETDQAGFLDRRILARQWLDWTIVRNFRGISTTGYGDGYAQFTRGWAGLMYRSPQPSQWLLDLLSGTNVGGANPTLAQGLIVRPWVVRATAYRAVELIGKSQIGINNQYAVFGRIAGEEAESILASAVAEIDTNADGKSDLPIPLGVTNTIFT